MCLCMSVFDVRMCVCRLPISAAYLEYMDVCVIFVLFLHSLLTSRYRLN